MFNDSKDEYKEEELYLNNITIAPKLDPDEIYTRTIVEVPLWYHSTVCLFLTSLGINGTLLNGLVLRHFWHRRMFQTPYNLILINLAFVELIMAMVGASSDVIALIQNGWKIGKLACIAEGVLVNTAGFVSILTLSVLSVFGYGSVFRFSGRNQEKPTFTTVSRIICLVWLCSLTLSLPPLFGWGRYVPELSGLGCAADWHSEQSSRTYVVWILVFGFLIPTIIIAVSSVLTYAEAQKQKLTLSSKKRQPFSTNENQINVQLVIAMNIAYVTCWSPYAIICFIHSFISKTMIGPMLSMIPTIAVKISVCANPLLYIAYKPRTQFSTASLKILQKFDEDLYVNRRKSFRMENTQTVDFNVMQSLRSILQDTVPCGDEGKVDIKDETQAEGKMPNEGKDLAVQENKTTQVKTDDKIQILSITPAMIKVLDNNNVGLKLNSPPTPDGYIEHPKNLRYKSSKIIKQF